MIFKPYGIFIALAVLAGVYWTRREAKRAGQDPEKIWEILPWVLAGGLVGARLYHVAHYWWYYAPDFWRIFQVWNGGLGVYGALAGGVIGLLAYLALGRIPNIYNLKSIIYNLKLAVRNFRFYILDFRFYLDLAAPGIALGQAVGRLGNVVNGELLPFALYEAGWDFLVFLLLVRLPFLKVTPYVAEGVTLGKRFSTYLFLYAFGRFFLEFLRTDNIWRWGSLAAAQWVSLGLIGLIGLIRWAGNWRRGGKELLLKGAFLV